ncbi:MAG: transposase [Acidimicrobiaceae bacterium]|nr:transposase [Acidimicrobiaceae bacterium]
MRSAASIEYQGSRPGTRRPYWRAGKVALGRSSNWHTARVTNAATEAANNLIKRVKRAAFGFTNFANYRVRALLYAGRPNWALLDTLTPT